MNLRPSQSFWATILLTVLSGHCTAQAEASSESLLPLAHSIVKSDSRINQQREALFKLEYDQQKELLGTSQKRLLTAESEQTRLKKAFDSNEQTISELEERLRQRSGALGEVFGVAKESALELVPMLQDSLTSAEWTDRKETLAFSQSKSIPTLADINALFSQLELEMSAVGQVATFTANVVGVDGSENSQSVKRIGPFASITEDGSYLAWDVREQVLKTLATQPSQKAQFEAGDADSFAVLLDPSRGELFALLDRMPSLSERVKQGGAVGYLIIGLGVLGILIALYQLVRLVLTELSVRKQLSRVANLDSNNPLGRVLASIKQGQVSIDDSNLEAVEMKVDEAILKELPKIEQGQSFLKLLAAVAPLLGLLGTVVGMIATFQSITLFGTSDPKLMANGISQALMTTVLGLVVAVPVLFCHSVLVARGKRLVQVLQEKSLGALVSIYQVEKPKEGHELHVA